MYLFVKIKKKKVGIISRFLWDSKSIERNPLK